MLSSIIQFYSIFELQILAPWIDEGRFFFHGHREKSNSVHSQWKELFCFAYRIVF